MGGNGAWMLAAKKPELFGALVVVASDLRQEFHSEIASQLVYLPILCIHCFNDQYCPVTEIEKLCWTMQKKKSRAGAEQVLQTIFLSEDSEYGEYCHDYWNRFFLDLSLLKWCF